jgi:beta-glucanase (GH16 family)
VELEDGDYVEARVWIPTGDGLWPAFWTLPDELWPPEIDIFELFDTSVQDRPTFVYHFPGPVGVDGPRKGAVYGAPTTDYRDSWHTYGMLRSNGVIVPFVDGVAYPEQGVPAGADALPQFLMFNLAVYAGKQPAAGTRMMIDWVRVWHRV